MTASEREDLKRRQMRAAMPGSAGGLATIENYFSLQATTGLAEKMSEKTTISG